VAGDLDLTRLGALIADRTREASRVVTVMPAGRLALREHFGVTVDDTRCTRPAVSAA
jgi:hypothetical protein